MQDARACLPGTPVLLTELWVARDAYPRDESPYPLR